MAQKKKLQVFISSTYSDLREERQAAVEAILTAGHIPAGMELFAAGDESQMNVIKRWIDESDAYMLILGGRYGSIEPTTQKSYIQLEYEYAFEKNKPLFAIVIDEEHLEEKLKQHGSKVIETDHPDKLKSFRATVLTKLVKFWRDTKDIKLAILETLSEFSNRTDLIGWIPGNEAINSGAIAEEIARLAKENTDLQLQIKNFSSSPPRYNGLTFEELCEFLGSNRINIDDYKEEHIDLVAFTKIKEFANSLGEEESTLLHYIWVLSRVIDGRLVSDDFFDRHRRENFKLYELGLYQNNPQFGDPTPFFSDGGKQFLLRFRRELKLRGIDDQKYILE